METDNGTGDMGKLPVIRTLATLAHDCGRTDLFQREIIAALRIVQRGDLPLRDLIGAMLARSAQTLLYQVRRRLRRQRPCRSPPQRAGCAGLDRQLAESQRLAHWRAVWGRHAKL
jgi:Transglycosylase SLT domain